MIDRLPSDYEFLLITARRHERQRRRHAATEITEGLARLGIPHRVCAIRFVSPLGWERVNLTGAIFPEFQVSNPASRRRFASFEAAHPPNA
jgi:hypothetical protein